MGQLVHHGLNLALAQFLTSVTSYDAGLVMVVDYTYAILQLYLHF